MLADRKRAPKYYFHFDWISVGLLHFQDFPFAHDGAKTKAPITIETRGGIALALACIFLDSYNSIRSACLDQLMG